MLSKADMWAELKARPSIDLFMAGLSLREDDTCECGVQETVVSVLVALAFHNVQILLGGESLRGGSKIVRMGWYPVNRYSRIDLVVVVYISLSTWRAIHPSIRPLGIC